MKAEFVEADLCLKVTLKAQKSWTSSKRFCEICMQDDGNTQLCGICALLK